MMEYKGYIGRVEFDDEAELFLGEVINVRDAITFQGASVAELKKEFQVSIEAYLDACTDQGRAPDNPNAGYLALNVAPELQAAMIRAARREHKSLDAWIVDRLAEAGLSRPTA
ncbi:Toxin-antitoxin system HicB family antitoxin [Gammaproteobacteria bacterium]